MREKVTNESWNVFIWKGLCNGELGTGGATGRGSRIAGESPIATFTLPCTSQTKRKRGPGFRFFCKIF